MYEREPIIGIDLETSFYFIAIIKNDKFEKISVNFPEENKIPSIISFKNKHIFINKKT